MASISTIFSKLPPTLAEQLLYCYREIVRNYVERRWEPAELNGGKFCEVVYTILEGAISGIFSPIAAKPNNIVDACKSLAAQPSNASRVGDRSLRILIPRLLPFLYEIRNNRGVGHVGGDVSPNHEDAEAVLAMASWTMAELVRIFHGVTLPEAQALVESLIQKRHPLVWEADGIRRVLDPSLRASDQTLILLYGEQNWIESSKLSEWIEYGSASMFRTRVLVPLHKQRLIEFDKKNGRAYITPLGIRHVEDQLLKAD